MDKLDLKKKQFWGHEYTPNVLNTSSQCIGYVILISCLLCETASCVCVRTFWIGVGAKNAKQECYNDWNVLAYFDDWTNRSGRHYLPLNVQTLLKAYSSTLFMSAS